MFKAAIVGYGNVGKGADLALSKCGDAKCVGIFTKRNPEDVTSLTGANVYPLSRLYEFSGKTDVLILCGGSASELPENASYYAERFNAVDSLGTDAKIPEYFEKMERAAKANNKLCAISVGWDPGLFSLARIVFESVLPRGKSYTFWGKGVSQGHTNAIKEISGVKYAVAYTVPKRAAINAARKGMGKVFTAREMHKRECFVVLEKNADKNAVINEIKNMPDYFSEYDTVVNIISEREFWLGHSRFPHGGRVIRRGVTGGNEKTSLDLSLKTSSNPQLTGEILAAYARAVCKMRKAGFTGAVTAMDIPLKYLSEKDENELRRTML